MANIVLTSRCNLSCQYCFAHELTESDACDIKMKDFMEILDFAGADGEIGLIGGEPLLHKDINEFISILKETSVIGFLGVMDLTRFAEKVITRTADVYYPYLSVALIYLVMVMGLNYLVKKLEKRLAKSDRR